MANLTRQQKYGLALAQVGSVLIALGGLGDQMVQKLTPSHEAFLGFAPGKTPHAVEQLFLAVLHALGASLIGIGIGSFVLLRKMAATGARWLGGVVVAMVLLGDGVNAYEIERTGSSVFLAPLSFVVITVTGVALFALSSREGGTMPS